jgi:hypothetical protein
MVYKQLWDVSAFYFASVLLILIDVK